MKKQFYIGAALAAILALNGCGEKTPSGNSEPVKVTKVSLPDGITIVEQVKGKKGEISIPYTKYKLDNGLTLVIHEDKSDPLVHVDITYHVGSGREDAGKSGFAHFFEHMMFQGSDNVADEQHFSLITESGGTLNGSTNTDRTNYYETVPSNQLERMLWLESDRMGFFLDAVTQKKFETQRETVKNERGQRVDNRPYGLLGERIGEAMYPEGHPYSWSVIGYLADLDRADLADLKKFFLRWYGPNNATLTIGGDLDKEQTLKWVQQYFGGIPAGPKVDNPVYEPVVLSEDRYISLEDNVNLPLLYMSWPTVSRTHPDEAPLDVLMDIIGVGKTSLLYKNMVKSGKAVQAQTGHACAELGCTFTMLALPTPGSGTSLADLEKIARASLVEFEENGADDDSITRVKAGIVSGMVFGLESVSGKISQLAAYQTFQGNPNFIGADIARYESVTKEDVMRVYKKYIKDKHAVIMSIVPKGQGDTIIKPDTWDRYERTIPASTPSELELRPGTSNFDRSVVPASGPNPAIKVPTIYKASTKDGVKILGTINAEVPTTAIRIRIPAGQTREALGKLGLASLTAGMMGEATKDHSAEDLSNALNKIGSSVRFNSGDLFTTINIRSLSKNLDETLAIAKERLFSPKMDQADFDRLQKQTLASLKNDQKNAPTTASRAFNKLLFGTNNSFAFANTGTIASVEKLTSDDVRKFYENNYGPKNAEIIVVSDLSEEKISKALSILGGWEGGHTDAAKVNAYPDLAGGTLYLIDKPAAAQSEIRIGKRALNYDPTGEYYRARLMNYNLGGAFNSRINLNLREDKGYTYGARSFFAGNKFSGRYQASAGVRADSTSASIIEFVKEISSFNKDGMTAKELGFMKSALGQRDARSYETPRQKLGLLANIASYDLPISYIDDQNAILANITADELNNIAAKHLNIEDMIILVVGDKAKIGDDLKDLGYPIVELNPDGSLK